MKICFICDVHIPYIEGSIQHDALKWACDFVERYNRELLIVAGDFTANGDLNAARFFEKEINKLKIPVIIMTGNSDYRTPENREHMRKLRSPSMNMINGQVIYAVDDGEGVISDETINELNGLNSDAIVVMHHPIDDLPEPAKSKMSLWRENHPDILLFCAHRHVSEIDGNTIYLQSLDPDKAIGTHPCVVDFDTETKICGNALYYCPAPKDIFDYIGISCFYPIEDTKYAAENNIRCIELRDTAVNENQEMLEEAVELWRSKVGTNLSMHAPEVTIDENENVGSRDEWDKFIALAKKLDADRITLHVPKASLRIIREKPNSLENISCFLSEYFKELKPECVIGVENMHMTSSEKDDMNRRFGYIPDEVIEFMNVLSNFTDRKVGINFDVGHARNNSPFSQKYNIGAWYKEVGKYCVGYHIHQVTLENGKFYNHMPIEHIYGKLISYASLLKCWSLDMINKAPIICEIRGDGTQAEYKSTLEMFDRIKKYICRDDD